MIMAYDNSSRGYTNMKSQYSQPSRCDTYLRKRLNLYFNDPFSNRVNLTFNPGLLLRFTVKAKRFEIIALTINQKEPDKWFPRDGAQSYEYRFFDTTEEARHHKALRSFPVFENSDKVYWLGHLVPIQRRDWRRKTNAF